MKQFLDNNITILDKLVNKQKNLNNKVQQLLLDQKELSSLKNRLDLLDSGIVANKSSDYYKCVSVDTVNKAWTGYKAVLNGGVYTFENMETTGLTYGTSFIPVVGNIYDAEAFVKVSDLYRGINIPTDNLVFYASLSANSDTAETGQSLTKNGSVAFVKESGIQCARFSGGSISVSPYFAELVDGGAYTASFWIKIERGYTGGIMSFAPGKHGYASAGLLFGTNEESILIFGSAGTYNYNTAVDLTAWTHVLAVCDGLFVRLFVDGIEKTSANMWTINIDSRNPTIGDTNNLTGLNGFIAGVRLYNRAVDESEILSLASEFTPTA